MTIASEVQTKLQRVRNLMDQRGITTLWLRSLNNVAWITGGVDAAVNTAHDMGVASVVITGSSAEVWTNTIEAPRLRDEDQVEERGFGLHVDPWEGPGSVPPTAGLGVDLPFGGAADLSGDLTALRVRLLPVEQDRFRHLGISCGEAMQRSINRVHPGSSEHEIAAALAYEMRIRGVSPIVVLVATDERIFNFRHPLPTNRIMENYAMLVLCGRRYGLVCSVTRLLHFGPLSDDLRQRMEACAQVDAAMIAASQPGASLEHVFHVAQDTYAATGYEGEWKKHHQGGLAGYTARDALGVPGATLQLEPGMVLAWNPSITGTKSEDSVMVPEPGGEPEVLTRMYGWPMREIEINGLRLERPLIMEL